MDVHVTEWHVAGEAEAHHHHAGHPEEDDVEASDEHAGGVVPREVPRALRPAERRKGPERRAEPGVEDVGLLDERGAPTGGALGRVLARDDRLAARLARPDGDAVAPPELARDAPVADVLHPREVRVLPLLRDEARATVAHGRERRTRERLDLDEPLPRDERLDDGPAAVADADPVAVRLLALEETQDRKSTRLNSSHSQISYAVFCLEKKKKTQSIRC